jgi:Zn-dependent oligopeptidase
MFSRTGPCSIVTLPTDDNLVKEYFPVSKVVPAVLDIYKDLLGIELVAVPRDEAVGGITWHDDAELYAVWEAGQAQSGNRDAFLGYMFLDLSPRENKYGHAAVWGLIPGWTDPETKERQFPVVCMVANLSKPTPGRPATMVSPPSPFRLSLLFLLALRLHFWYGETD